MSGDPWDWTETFSSTDQPRELRRIVQPTAANETACPWCRECGSCDYGLAMSCTCGDCTCADRCGHPRCARGWTPPGEPVCDTCGGRGYLLTASGPDGDLIDQEPCPDCSAAGDGARRCFECATPLSATANGPYCCTACAGGENPEKVY